VLSFIFKIRIDSVFLRRKLEQYFCHRSNMPILSFCRKMKVFLKALLRELVLRIYTMYKDVDKTLLL